MVQELFQWLFPKTNLVFAKIESRSANAMKRFESMLADGDINVRMKVYKAIGSEPRNILVEYTQSSNADILIMGSRNLTTWKR
jgi:hypothetical protein